ncbi:hypothetical protein ILYODFUR_020641 [Ilyodon furcidens]|uniref:Uncharacterized protein n=1 Tax=Ilyodon furcidens TaxID=33524 RepID=A0ABV0SPM8_9TELE
MNGCVLGRLSCDELATRPGCTPPLTHRPLEIGTSSPQRRRGSCDQIQHVSCQGFSLQIFHDEMVSDMKMRQQTFIGLGSSFCLKHEERGDDVEETGDWEERS